MPGRSFALSTALVLCSLAILMLPGFVEAQSGRRLPNQNKQPAAPPLSKDAEKAEADKEAAEEKKSAGNKETPKIPVFVATTNNNMTSPQYYTDLVVQSFADRLQKAGGIQITVGRDMNRKEASDQAKNSTEGCVVLLQLEPDSASGGLPDYNSRQDPRYLVIDYTVFEPRTGKTRASGRTYPREQTAGPVPIPQTRGSAEYRLKRAAEEAADRVLGYIGQLTLPPRK